MDSTLTQKNLQRAQPNENVNGPRVSFNKDVHVKRIGNRPNEINSSYTLNGNTSPQPPYTRQLPQDLTEEALLKEAEKVIAQTGRIKCTVDTPNSLAGIRLQDKSAEDQKFNSLPHRRVKPSKPLGRSVSDASQKKPKRASIFSLFSKRSDPNINSTTTATGNDIQSSGGGESPSTTNNNQKRARKAVGRSKSDVGYNSSDSSGGRGKSHSTLDRKRIKIPDSDESMTKVKKKSQLSPIIENPSTVGKHFDYFSLRNDTDRNADDNKQRNHLRNAKSEEKTLTTSSPSPASSSQLRSQLTRSNKLRFDDEDNGSPSRRPNIQSHSLENLHSSQLPQEKLPLTKGVRVDGIVKRLSMDRFSPPLTFNSPAFSYTRPQEPIVYAQVLRDENGEKTKPSMVNGLNGHRHGHGHQHESSPPYLIHNRDQVDSTMPSRSRTLFDRHMPIESQPQHFGVDRHNVMHMNSDEDDEGLGFDEKKQQSPRRDISRQSSSEPPIIPTLHPSYGSMEHLANRRKLLESKIHERSFGREANGVGGKTHIVPIKRETIDEKDDDREFQNNKFNQHVNHHQPIEQPKKTLFTPTPRKQWIKQPKYYPETNLDDEFLSDMDSIRREQERQRHKDYLDKTFERLAPSKQPGGNHGRIIDLGYIDQYDDSNRLNNNNSKVINHNLSYKHRMNSAEPKTEVEWVENGHNTHQHQVMARIDNNDHRRKLDKVDSGIENDFKQRDRSETRSNSRTRRIHVPTENIKNITELFLKRECQFSESMHPSKRRFDFVFRERSIDDGSHFDPRLDKYPENQQKSRSLSRTSPQSDDGKKSDKKFNSLKKIFSLGSKKKHSPEPVVQHSIPDTTETIDIATRRRLSTPKASPVPKRIPSQKSSKMSHVSSHRSSDVSAPPAPKTSWFKSLERLSRKKSKAPDEKKSSISTVKRSNTTANRPTYQRAQSPSPDPKPRPAPVQQNLRFFGDTDLESLSKASTNIGRKRTALIPNSAHSMQNLRSNRPSQSRTVTDLNTHSRHHVRTAASMQNLNSDFRAKYLPDLSESTSENENTVRKNTINRREADQHPMHHSTPNSKYQKHQRRQYHSMEYLENDEKPEPIRSESGSNRSHNTLGGRGHDQKHSSPHRSALRERNGRSTSENRHLPPIGPTKPAREFDRRRALSNDRFLDSSGTEGESSQQSVVYLHATTVGHIPQPYVASSRRSSKSRDELSSIKTKSSSPPQPMTRTVSRSVSMLAPWTPRHISDGYEINYSQTMQNPKKKASNLKKDNLRKARSRDDVSSKRSNSSMTKSSTLPRNNNNNRK